MILLKRKIGTAPHTRNVYKRDNHTKGFKNLKRLQGLKDLKKRKNKHRLQPNLESESMTFSILIKICCLSQSLPK